MKLGLGTRPFGATWLQVYGVALLCGIGFTMSLFIAVLAYEAQAPLLFEEAKLGVLAGSLLGAMAGVIVLLGANWIFGGGDTDWKVFWRVSVALIVALAGFYFYQKRARA